MRYLISLLLALTIGMADTAFAADASNDKTAAKTQGEKYPAEAVKSLFDGCAKSKDVPADMAKPVCTCYAILMQGTIPYSLYTKVGADLKAKGPGSLDDQEKAAMEQNSYNVNYCRLKHQVAGTAEERATFPQSALPALHASCMNFKDLPDDKKESFCNCYESLIRTKLSYSDWELLGLAIETKGIEQLDTDETRIFNDVRKARMSCGGMPAK